MNKLRKVLLITAASLALNLTGCSGGKTPSGEGAAPAADTAPVNLTTIMQDYNTAASRHLKSLEADFNKNLPSGVSPIVYLDYDKIATWFGMREGPATVESGHRRLPDGENRPQLRPADALPARQGDEQPGCRGHCHAKRRRRKLPGGAGIPRHQL